MKKNTYYFFSILSLLIFLVIISIGCGGGSELTIPAKEVVIRPSSPVSGEIINLYTETAEISWYASKEVEFFNVYVNGVLKKTISENEYSTSEVTTNNQKISYKLNDLKKDSSYIISVKSLSSKGVESDKSMIFQINTIESASIPVPPKSLTFVSSTLSSAKINFNEGQYAAKYQIYIDGLPYTLDSKPVYIFKAGTYEILNLNASTDYDITIKSINGYGYSDTSEVLEISTGSSPSKPTIPVVGTLLDKSVNIQWSSVLNATKYFVYIANISADPNAQLSLYSTVTNTTAIISNLSRGTTYDIAIKAWNKYGDSPYSDTIEITTKNIPSTPTGLAFTELTLTSFKISWPSVSTADSYKIYKNGLFYASVNASASTPSYTLGSLSSDSTYEIQVSSVNEFGESDKSTKEYVHTLSEDGDPPAIPAGFTITPSNIKPTSMIITWTTVPETSNYRVYYNDVYGNTNNTSYQIDNLTPDTSYTIGIEAYNDFGYTTKQTTTVSTLSEPLPVESIEVESKSKNFIKINWSEADGANKYFVYCRRTAPTTAVITEDTVEVTTYSFSGLTSGATFEITIYSSYNSNRQTSINSGSNENQIYVFTPSTPDTPIISGATNISQNSADVTWGSVSNADYYNVYRKRILTESTYSLASGSGTSLTTTTLSIDSLTVDSTYEILVTAVSITPTGEHLESAVQTNALSFKTLPNIPNPPNNLRYDGLTKDTDEVFVYWERPSSTDYYYVYAPGHNPERQKVLTEFVRLDDWSPSPGSIIPTSTTIEVSAYNYFDLNSGTSEILIPLDELTTPVIGIPYPDAVNTDTQMYVEWDTTEISTAYSYIIKLYDDDAASYVVLDNGQEEKALNNKYYTFTNLTSDNNYTVEVKKIKNGKGESFTASKSFATNSAPDTVVFEAITLADYSTKEIIINWDSATPHALLADYNTDTFEIYAKQSTSTTWKLIAEVEDDDIDTGGNNPAFTYTMNKLGDTGAAPPLSADTTYDIRVVAKNSIASRTTTLEDTYKTDYAVDTPYNLTVLDKGLDFIYLSWEIDSFMSNNDRPDTFVVEWDTGSRVVSGDTYEIYIGNLFSSTTYNINVTSVNPTDTDHAVSTPTKAVKTGSIPDVPIITAIDEITSSSMKIDWSEGSFTDYYIVRLTDGTNEITSNELSAVTEYTMTGLDYRTTYTVEVQAYNTYGYNSGEASKKITTKAKFDVFEDKITGGAINTSSPYNPYISVAPSGDVVFSKPGNIGDGTEHVYKISSGAPSITDITLIPNPDGGADPTGICINGSNIYSNIQSTALNFPHAFTVAGGNDGSTDAYNLILDTIATSWGNSYDLIWDETNTSLYAISEYGGDADPDLIKLNDIDGAGDGSLEIEVVATDTGAQNLALDEDGYLLVANPTTKIISIYDTNNISSTPIGTINLSSFTIDGVYGMATNFDGTTKYLVVACGNKILFYSGTGSSYTNDPDLTLDSSNPYTTTDPDDGLSSGFSISGTTVGTGGPSNARGIATLESGATPVYIVIDSGNNQIIKIKEF